MGFFSNAVQRLVPPRYVATQTFRARLLVEVMLVCSSLSLASAVIALFVWTWAAVAISLVAPLAMAGCYALLRRGHMTLATHVTLAFVCSIITFTLVAWTPLQTVNLVFMTPIPFLAAVFGGPRGSLVWAMITIAAGGTALFLVGRGYSLGFPMHEVGSPGLVPYVLAMVLVMMIAQRYEALRRSAEDEARAADRAKSAFLAAIGHEIRTPMNGVLGMTELLLLDAVDGTDRERLGVIQRSGHLMVTLINDLLDFSKIEAGKLEVDSVDFELQRLLRDMEQLYAPAALRKGLELSLLVEGTRPGMLRGDPQRLRQILGNLVSNAVKFTHAGGVRLRVATRRSDANRWHVLFSIEDTGIGISADAIDKLFTPFKQADGSTRRRYGGTGLGLALSKQLVELLGGTLAVDSVPGKGSRFYFTVPIADGELTPLPFTQALPTVPVGGPKVLIVDDNPINLKVAEALVAKAGYLPTVCASGREAVDLVQRELPAAVLMDCHMPDMDGYEATERIRALGPAYRLLPIIALTASAAPEDAEACRRAGMNAVQVKPLSLAALAQVLSSHVAAPLAARPPPPSRPSWEGGWVTPLRPFDPTADE